MAMTLSALRRNLNMSYKHASILKRLLSFDIKTPADFNEKVIHSKVPVIVDFHARLKLSKIIFHFIYFNMLLIINISSLSLF